MACNITCMICQENMLKDEEVCTLQCKHKFHSKCIQVWFVEQPVCPLKCNGEGRCKEHRFIRVHFNEDLPNPEEKEEQDYIFDKPEHGQYTRHLVIQALARDRRKLQTKLQVSEDDLMQLVMYMHQQQEEEDSQVEASIRQGLGVALFDEIVSNISNEEMSRRGMASARSSFTQAMFAPVHRNTPPVSSTQRPLFSRPNRNPRTAQQQRARRQTRLPGYDPQYPFGSS